MFSPIVVRLSDCSCQLMYILEEQEQMWEVLITCTQGGEGGTAQGVNRRYIFRIFQVSNKTQKMMIMMNK